MRRRRRRLSDREERLVDVGELVKANPAYERLLDLSSRIEGISRHMSVHAAGVVIAPGPLAEYVPVCTAPTKGAGAAADGEESIITQYEMGALEKVGMLKMDMLGLKTLTVIHDAVLMIAARTGLTPEPGDAIGWNGDGVEAEGFAYMAVRTLENLPISFPGTTGVPAPMTGGVIHRV